MDVKQEIDIVQQVLGEIRDDIKAGKTIPSYVLKTLISVGISCEIKSEYPRYKGYTLQIGIDEDMNISKLELVKD